MVRTLLTLDQAAELLQVSYGRMAELTREGIVPVVRLGLQVRIDPSQMDEFISRGGKCLAGGWRKEASRS